MSYKPILFNTEMVKAIQDGRKTQTRRIVKNQDGIHPRRSNIGFLGWDDGHGYQMMPPCKEGDILWVRETWQHVYTMDDNDQPLEGTCRYIYYADNTMPFDYWVDKDTGEHKEQMPWRPSIHMPKEAARIFLQVKDVRVERLRQITQQDAVSEGISRLFDHMTKAEYEKWANRSGVQAQQSEQPWKNYLWHGHFGAHGMGNKISDAWPWQFSSYETPCGSFSSLWNSTVPLKEWDNYGWGANPWVWVIKFERCERPADFL